MMLEREPQDLQKGVRDAVAQFVPHLKDVETGTVISKSFNTVVCIADEVVVKYGERVTNAEVNSIRFVSECTSVPVPNVHGLYNDGDSDYLVMKYVKGDCLYDVWNSLMAEQKEELAGQLHSYFQELHSLKETYIGAVGKHPPVDDMFCGAQDCGPYDSEESMNEAIVRSRRSSWERYGGSPPECFVTSILPSLPYNHDIVFSHGNFRSSSLIVDMEKETVKICALVGWGSAGFFPEHWDFVNALVFQNMKSDWIRYVPIILKPYYQEYALWYRLRQRAIGII